MRAALSGYYHPGACAKSGIGAVYSTAPAFFEAPFKFRLVDLARQDTKNVTDCSVE